MPFMSVLKGLMEKNKQSNKSIYDLKKKKWTLKEFREIFMSDFIKIGIFTAKYT
jgi:hypothetical protein